MTAVLSTLRGVIHGKMIELAEEAGFPDGQEVSVSLKPVEPSETPWPPGVSAKGFGARSADGLRMRKNWTSSWSGTVSSGRLTDRRLSGQHKWLPRKEPRHEVARPDQHQAGCMSR